MSWTTVIRIHVETIVAPKRKIPAREVIRVMQRQGQPE